MAKKKRTKETIAKRAKKAKKKLASQVKRTRDHTWVKTAHTAQKVLQLQESTFDGTFKLITQIQGQCEKAVREYVGSAEWLPEEGKAVVEEWVKTIHNGRVSFQKTVQKSFGLLDDYFARVQAEEEEGAGAAGKAKAKAGSKAAVTKAPAPRKKAAAKKKAAPRKRPAKKKAVEEPSTPGAQPEHVS